MIISYIDTDIDSVEYQQRVDSFSYICEIFFTEIDKDIQIVTERNPIVLLGIINYYKATHFQVDSIKDFPFSPTQISELIIFILNNDCTFQSQRESIDYDKNNIIDVYQKVFQCLRQS